MKVRENSGKVVVHPQTRARRERALARRMHDLAEWQDPESDRCVLTNEVTGDHAAGIIARKIECAKADITALNDKGIK